MRDLVLRDLITLIILRKKHVLEDLTVEYKWD